MFRIPEQRCPSCNARLTASTFVSLPGDDSKPEPPRAGHVTMCIECGVALVFDDRQRLFVASMLDLMALDAHSRRALAVLQSSWREWVDEGRPDVRERAQ